MPAGTCGRTRAHLWSDQTTGWGDRALLRFALVIAAVLALPATALANTPTWNGTGPGCDGKWTTPACWNGGAGPAPTSNPSTVIVIGNSGTALSPGPTPANLNTNFTMGSLTFNNTGVGVTIGTLTSNSFSLASAGSITDNNQAASGDAINVNLALLGPGTITLGSGATGLTLGGVISGSGLLTLTNNSASGLITLSGNNIYSGGTDITAGVVAVSTNANLGTGSVKIENGATLELTASNTFNHTTSIAGTGTINVKSGQTATWNGVIGNGISTGTLDVAGGGTLILGGNNTYSGGTEILSGASLSISNNNNLGTGSLKVDNSATLDVTLGGTYTTATSISGTATFNLSNGTTVNWNAVIADGASAGTLDVTGGGTLVMQQSNTYTGGTEIKSGAVSISADGQLGTGSVKLDDGTTLDITATGSYGSNALSMTGTGTIVITGGQTVTWSGAISDGTSKGSIVVSGGTLNLTGSTSYTGSTTVAANTILNVATNGEIPVASDVIDNGTINFGVSSTIGSLAGSGNVTITNAGPNTLTVGNSNSTNFSGVYSGATNKLLKVGSGTLTLSGTNNYGGGTEISAGAINISADTNFAGPVTIDNGAVLSITATGTYTHALSLVGTGTIGIATGDTVTWSGSIGDGASPGSLKVVGGTLDLTGATSYTGTTTVAASTILNVASNNAIPTGTDVTDNGTINFGASSTTIGSLAGTGNVTITNAGTNTLTVGDTVDSTFSGVYSTSTGATNKLLKVGTDTLTLSGANTYSGGTEISAGTISVSSDGNLGGAGAVTIDAGATLKVTGAGSYAHALDLTGTGTVTVTPTSAVIWNGVVGDGASAGTLKLAGTGILELTQTETYTGGTTVSGGTLIVGNGSTSGSIAGMTGNPTATGSIVDDAQLDFYRSDSVSYLGSISGTCTTPQVQALQCSLYQNGSGTLTLSAAGTYTYNGLTTVALGTLNVMGNITTSSGVLVDANATLSGGGTVPQTNILNHGTLAPGAPGTTLSIQGAVTFNPLSTYVDQLTTTQSLQLNATGTATLTGALILKPTGTFAVDQQMVILSAGALSGQFTSQSLALGSSFQDSASNTLIPIVTYNTTQVIVTADAASLTPYLPAGANRNERSVAKAIDFAMANYVQTAVPLFAPIANPAAAAQFLTTLDTFTGEVGPAAQDTVQETIGDFMGELDEAGGLGGPERTAALASRNSFAQLAYNGPTNAMPLVRRAPARPYELWGSVHGASNTSDADSKLGTHSTHGDDVGGTLGFDMRATSGRAVIGLAFSYDDVGWTLASSIGKGDAKAYQAGFYGSFLFGQTYVSIDGALGGYDAKTFRALTYGGNTNYRAAFSANDEELRMEVGERYYSDAGTFSPYFNTRLGSLSTPAYTETNTGAPPNFALSYSKQAHTDATSELGLAYDSLSGMDVPDSFGFLAKLGWQHDFTAGMSDTASFEAFPGASFTVHGAQPPKDAAHAVIGLEDNFGGAALTLDFNGLLGMKSRTIGGDTGIVIRW